jgi:hypothetical protein
MRTDYPAKVLLAWAEAIGGNTALRDWLIKNGYPELGIFTYALRNKEDARQWLMDNGHKHLLAVITGVEGDQRALAWLERSHLNIMRHMALAGDDHADSFQWLLDNGHRELAMVSKKMWVVKQQIHEDNHDPHKYSQD